MSFENTSENQLGELESGVDSLHVKFNEKVNSEIKFLYNQAEKEAGAHFEERSRMNLLSFGIVGSILSFAPNTLNHPISLLGVIILIGISLISLINIANFRKASLIDFVKDTDLYLKKVAEVETAFDKYHQTNSKENIENILQKFDTFLSKEEISPSAKFINFRIESYYFLFFAIGLILTTTGLVDWDHLLSVF